jgi:two-component system response regulator HydG
VLIVDDDAQMCSLLETTLGLQGFSCTTAATAEEALSLARESPFDVVLTDVYMPGTTGIELCGRLAECCHDVPVVVMTAFGSMEAAVGALRAGAFDFVTKPVDADVLGLVVQRAADHHALLDKVRLLSHPVETAEGFPDLLGTSPAIQEVKRQVARVAMTDASILITGESGTGKELVAREICRRSRRHDRPFVAVNCAALPESLVESELFGHVRGAFTDARTERRGLFAEAHHGTLFLDEIGDLPLSGQPKLLRALEEQRIRPVGSDREQAIDVRLIAATHCDLKEAIEEGRFREDLYYRIETIEIRLPPLRERGLDVLEIAQHFAREMAERHQKPISGFSDAAARKLVEHRWSGNVRELRNAVERAVALARREELQVEDLPEKVREPAPSLLTSSPGGPTPLRSLEALERDYIGEVLSFVDGNKARAARILGLDRKTLYRKLHKYESEDRDPRGG